MIEVRIPKKDLELMRTHIEKVDRSRIIQTAVDELVIATKKSLENKSEYIRTGTPHYLKPSIRNIGKKSWLK